MKDTVIAGTKKRLRACAYSFAAVLMIIQPLLDVLSYYMKKNGTTVVTTTIRAVMLLLVVLYGFIIEEKRKPYYVAFGVMAAFWVIHALNCLRLTYNSPMGDAAEFLKLIQVPLWTLVFISMFRQSKKLETGIYGLLAICFLVIVAVIGVSYLTGHPAYTYDYADRGIQIGILGWFEVANTQSAIVSMLAAPLIYGAYRTKKFPLYVAAVCLGIGLLYFTGTRLAYYAAILISAAFIVVLLVHEKNFLYAAPLVAALALVVVFKEQSPTDQRRNMASDTHAYYQQHTDEIMGEYRGYVHTGSEAPEEAIRERIERVYLTVYGDTGRYNNPMLKDLIAEFGVDRVMEKYSYSTDADMLYDVRVKRMKCCEMLFEDKDLFTKLFGFEYTETYIGGNIYDPENDFPALFFYYGYIGAGLYILFLAYFVGMGVRYFFQRFPKSFNLRFVTLVLMFGLLVISAQFSGQVLRRPNIGVYGAVASACLFACCRMDGQEPKRRDKPENLQE